MALGFYETVEKFPTKIDAAKEKLVAIFELLGWKYHVKTESEMIAYTPFSAFGGGELITVTITSKHHLKISSESRNPFHIYDLGKNRHNVEKLVEIFLKATLPLEDSDYASEKHRSFINRFFSAR